MLNNNTFLLEPANIKRQWHIIDAADQVLGRLSTKIVGLLRGKGKHTYTPHVDNGDFVIITNASKVRLTGKKSTLKSHFRHSGYPGGVHLITYGTWLKEKPEQVIRESVKAMLPSNHTTKKMLKRLRIFAGAEHAHKAQLKIS
jgi:large subunit ribosomal protein L13